jgi:hypothetical protein
MEPSLSSAGIAFDTGNVILFLDGTSSRMMDLPFLFHVRTLCPVAEKQKLKLGGSGAASGSLEARFFVIPQRKPNTDPRCSALSDVDSLELLSVDTADVGLMLGS